jgi:hypothetical protein
MGEPQPMCFDELARLSSGNFTTFINSRLFYFFKKRREKSRMLEITKIQLDVIERRANKSIDRYNI